MKFDYTIIGQGLAGSILAYQLLQRNKKVLVIDSGYEKSASFVAAGLVNPFTGPKMVKTWKAESLFPFLYDFYVNCEKDLHQHFFYPQKIYRPFGSIEEQNDWLGRSADPGYQLFLERISNGNAHCDIIRDPIGGIEVKGGYLDLPVFLGSVKHFLQRKACFVDEKFEEEKLNIFTDHIKYKQYESEKIIFCTGYQVMNSNLFGWLPMSPVKGEILHIKTEKPFETIYNKSCFIIPLGDGVCKAGSTYDINDLTTTPTEKGSYEIRTKLETLLKLEYDIIKHEAGIRPGTKTRRPMIGMHPKFKNVGIFNGLGTKGVSLAPYFSDHFVNYLENGNNLDKEVNIERYYSLYFKQHFSM